MDFGGKYVIELLCKFRRWKFGGKCWWKMLLENFWQKLLEELPYLISVNSLLFKNIQYIGSRKHFVFVCVCVGLSFCKSSSRALSPPDDKLTENIQGVPKKMSHSVLKLKSVVEVRFYFSTCVSESEFRARSI